MATELSAPAHGAQKGPLTDGAYEMLRCAVTLARNEQILSAEQLKVSLVARYPARTEDIDQGLQFWADSMGTRYAGCFPRE